MKMRTTTYVTIMAAAMSTVTALGDYAVLDRPLAFYDDAVLKVAMPR